MPCYEFQKLYLLGRPSAGRCTKGDRESNYADIRGALSVHKNGKGFPKDGQTLTEKETEDENKDYEYLFYSEYCTRTNALIVYHILV
jgi:hypothetical protein